MTDIIAFLDRLYSVSWLYTMEQHWLGYLLVGIYIVLVISAAAFASVRMGVSPLWTLLLIVPVLQIVAIAGVAYVRWPRVDGPRVIRADQGG
jgi:hypothetical protein